MSSALMGLERLGQEEVSLLTLLGNVGGCAPAGGLLSAMGVDRKRGRGVLSTLEAQQLVRSRPMLGEELVQMISPAWELLGLPPKVTTRLTYKRIRTGDLCLQYFAEFGRHLSSEVAAGLPQERTYKEIRTQLAELGRSIRRQQDVRDRHAVKASTLASDPKASEKEKAAAEGRRSGAEKELKRLRQKKSELQREQAPFLASFRGTNRLESLGVYRDLGISDLQTWVALDLGYLAQRLPETLRRCDAVAAAARMPNYQILIWGVERAERVAVETQLKDLVESLGLRRPPQTVRVLPYARMVK
ncbi:MAG TPA: hypothetical protein VK191_08240 [Symbiobacteriaceae bacterium]|nr:hypothetical protein [Symbiobacteriaceae bacterium]